MINLLYFQNTPEQYLYCRSMKIKQYKGNIDF